MLRVEGLTTAAGAAALTFDVPNGRCVGLLGRDTSALLHIAECACGIRVPAAGRVSIDDLDILRDLDRARPQIAVGLSRTAHARTSLGEHAEAVAGMRRTRMTAADGIARLGLNAWMPLNTPSATSAAALIAALLPDAAIVILHDPLRDLDAGTRARAIEWIRSLAESGTSLLVTGSEERDVRSVSHSVIDVGAGR